tara:strand:- start:4034 stop:4435 length:402 start_codon:yes stop_codon:yes gene_type:complete
MNPVRAIIRRNGTLAALLLAASLLFKLLVPAGYMVSSENMVLTVIICADSTGEQLTRQISIPMKSSTGQQHDPAKSQCPFTALTMGVIGSVDLALLASAIAFILALGFAPLTAAARRDTPRLRPPSTGPPLAA